MNAHDSLLLVSVADRRYALPLSAVQRVVRMVDVTSLPGAPPAVMGVIDVAGDLVPVLSLRRRLELPQPEPSPGDRLVLAQLPRRRLALLVDDVVDVLSPPATNLVAAERLFAGDHGTDGVLRTVDGPVVICDLHAILQPWETTDLDQALYRHRAAAGGASP